MPAIATECRGGVTLIELLVTMAILGVIAGVTTMAARRFPSRDANDPAVILEDSVRRATAEARRIQIWLPIDDFPRAATINPDGSIVADSAFPADRLSGRVTSAR